jgi:ubiquinone/menaquinone biosynthesis C-methylase UbiE
VLIEPDIHMRRQLEHKLAALPRKAEVIEAAAEHLPFPDASFDTAVATLVLCTIADPKAAVAEVGRVLKPDGRLLFIEHVRAEDSKTARWQDRLEHPWSWFGRGCHPNRDTLATIEASLEVASLERDRLPNAPRIIRPLVVGEARRAAG